MMFRDVDVQEVQHRTANISLCGQLLRPDGFRRIIPCWKFRSEATRASSWRRIRR